MLLFAIMGAAVGCSSGREVEEPDPQTQSRQQISGHERMVALLEEIRQRAPDEFPFFGRQAHIRAREELRRFGAGANELERLNMLSVLGRHELFYEENPRLAVEHLNEAHDLFSQIERADSPPEHFEAWNHAAFLLGVAWLRVGETENCCARHGAQSCILPIRGEGVHTDPEGSRQAIKYFEQVIERVRQGKSSNTEQADSARWLMNIAYMTLGQYPDQVPETYRIPASYFESDIEFPEFRNVGPKLALQTFNHAGGVVVDDFDNDDYLDIFTSSSDPGTQARFFRNNRDGTFTDRSQEAGLTGIYGGLNMVQADYNNDGHLDVLILRGAWHRQFGNRPNSLLRNNGNATFTDVTFESGLGDQHYPSKTAAWADYDNDGDLDLFIGNEDSPEFRAPSQLFRNNDDGTFTDVAAQAGVQAQVFAMSCVWGDYDNDRYPDLYLGGNAQRDPRYNHLFRNLGDGTLEDVAVKLNLKRPRFSFPAWFWDYDNDGNLDLYVTAHQRSVGLLTVDALHPGTPPTHGIVRGPAETDGGGRTAGSWEYELPALYRGNGQGGFEELAAEQGLDYPTEPMGANFGDVNGDGYLDFYLATGNVPYWELRPNVMFLNRQGQGFTNVTMSGGFGHLQKGHGVSFADIDNDGDQDVYVQMGGQLSGDQYYDALFENPGFNQGWISIKLVGRQSNTSAIGARIHVRIRENGTARSIQRRINSGGSFGCNPLRQNIGLGQADRIEFVEIYWPTSDQRQRFDDVELNRSLQITEGSQTLQVLDLKPLVLGGQ